MAQTMFLLVILLSMNRANIVERAVLNESQLESGKAEFYVWSVPSSFSHVDMDVELEHIAELYGSPEKILYEWIGNDRFRLMVLDANGEVKNEIVCDGHLVRTRKGQCWDIRFLTDVAFEEPRSSIQDNFYDEIKPYLEIVLPHLFPLTEGLRISPQDYDALYHVKYDFPETVVIQDKKFGIEYIKIRFSDGSIWPTQITWQERDVQYFSSAYLDAGQEIPQISVIRSGEKCLLVSVSISTEDKIETNFSIISCESIIDWALLQV